LERRRREFRVRRVIARALEQRHQVFDAIIRREAPIDEVRQDERGFSQLLEDISFRGHLSEDLLGSRAQWASQRDLAGKPLWNA
jgi:hypothetical protein